MWCRSTELPPLDRWSRVKEWCERIYDGVMGVRPFARLAPYSEGGEDGRIYQEVNDALTGADRQRRAGGRPEQAGPVGGGADAAACAPSMACCSSPPKAATSTTSCARNAFTLIEVFLVAFAVMLLSSLYLAGTIAEPVRRLAAAADRVRFGPGGRERHSRLSRAQ